MKIYKSKYRNHWISPYTIAEKLCFWREIDYDEPWVKRVNRVLDGPCTVLQRVLNFVHPEIDYVKIDPWDTWSMDHTLGNIILPMLKQLQETKHGAPHTDDEDVPEYLRSHMGQPKEHEWDTDDLHFMRWDWILAEMIWAFEQVVNDAEDQFFDHTASNGLEPWDPKYVGPKWDRDGHMKWQERKNNGFRLFGKYYENLWD